MFIRLLALFTIVPIIELSFLIVIGSKIGAFTTIALIFLTGVAGAALARAQGMQVLRELGESRHNGAMPGDQLLQGLLVLIGGFTLLTPGFLTDLLGLSMLLPFTRRLYSRWIRNTIARKIKEGNWQVQIVHQHRSPFG